MRAIALALTLVLAGSATTWRAGGDRQVSAQSLGRLAEQETERRKAIVAPAKVLTDRDLKPVEPSIASTVQSTRDSRATAPVPVGSPKNAPPDAKYVSREASDWLNRMRDLKTKHDRFRLMAAALRTRVDSLSTDLDDTGDPRRRATIESERQSVRTERALTLADLAATTKQILDLEEEARRANVPPGWLRP